MFECCVSMFEAFWVFLRLKNTQNVAFPQGHLLSHCRWSMIFSWMRSTKVAQPLATVRNRSQPFACGGPMAVPMASSAKVVTFGGSKRRVVSFRVAGVALCDIPTCFTTCRRRFAWQAQYFSVYTPHFTLYTAHSTLYTLNTPHFTLHTLHFTLRTLHYTPHLTLFTLHFTIYTPHSTLYTTLYSPHFTVHTLHLALYTLHSTLYTVHATLHTVHSTFHTLHFGLHTPHFTLYTLHITLCGLLEWTLCLPGLFPGIWCVSQFLFGVCRSGGGTSFPL